MTVSQLVRVGDYKVWMLTSDFQFEKFARGEGVAPHLAPLDCVFKHYWRHGLNPGLVDVGAKYGVGAMTAASFLREQNRQAPIICFEPGAASAVIGQTLQENGFADLIELHEIAISDRSGETTMYSVPAHPEDNHIIRRNVPTAFDERTVRTRSLDDFCEERGISGPLIVKIDTQGAEPEVWRGAKVLLRTGLVTVLTEYTPDTFDGREDPVGFLQSLSERFVLVHVRPWNFAAGDGMPPAGRIDSSSLADFCSGVRSSATRWTDILCIPKELPGAEALAEEIAAV